MRLEHLLSGAGEEHAAKRLVTSKRYLVFDGMAANNVVIQDPLSITFIRVIYWTEKEGKNRACSSGG